MINLIEMLSTKVTFAIILLNELASVKPNKLGRRVLENGALLTIVGVERKMLKHIIQQLHAYNVITYNSPRNIVLNSDLKEITLYDLYQIFHGGIPIGEEYEHTLHNGDYDGDATYPKIVQLEIDLKNKASAFFKRYTVASFAKKNKK